jgi:hypothetical protein
MAMRLTLRTLLAYLDDTLEPAEARSIGQKVAESETAQELIARIKEVTRKRRITTPAPGGPGSKVDPNAIAGYLDNALSPEALAEVEELALASDVHLAEIAACHQILTIVLGEPAMVPPTAYKRMYSIAKQPESNPNHEPPGPRESEENLAESKEVDETLRLGLPVLSPRGRWAPALVLAGGAACILALLGVALWQLLAPPLSRREGEAESLAKLSNSPKKPNSPDKANQPAPKADQVKAVVKDADTKDKAAEKEKQEEKPKAPEPKEVPPPAKENKIEVDVPPVPPEPRERSLGEFEPPSPPAAAVLVQLLPDKKQPERKHWTRLLRTKDPAHVLSSAPLLSLPGYQSVVHMDSGPRLTLWGNVPEFWLLPLALESKVTLHPSDQLDLDLTLSRGRIAIMNPKEQVAKVRLRFANPSNPSKGEIWDMSLLEKGTEVIVNMSAYFLPGEPFYINKDDSRRHGPTSRVDFLVHSGSAELKINGQPPEKLKPPPNGPILVWESRMEKPIFYKDAPMPPWVQPQPPLPKDADTKPRAAALAALSSLNIDLSGPSIETGLVKASATNDIQKRRLVVRCAGAMDDLQRVIDALEDKELDVRRAAIETARFWIAWGRDNEYTLFQQLQPKYSSDDAQRILTLLHRWTAEEDASAQVRESLVNDLTHKKTAIRELAHNYLLSLFPNGTKIGFNSTAADYQQKAKEWQKLVQQAK